MTPLTRCVEDENLSMGSSKKNISDGIKFQCNSHSFNHISGCDEGPGVCAMALTIVSLVLILVSLPLSLFCVVKVVQVNILRLQY